jgi:hypothetical protein
MSKRSTKIGLVEVTNRTSAGRTILDPKRELDPIIIGFMGRAQRTYPLLVHGFAFAAGHYHLLLTPESPRRLRQFVRFVERCIAREASFLSRCETDLWARKYRAIRVGPEESAQVARLRHILVHRHRGDLVGAAGL